MTTQYYDTKKLPVPFEQMTLLEIGDSNWDYFKHPTMDWVFSVAKVAGCGTSSFGNMNYYKQIRAWRRQRMEANHD